MSGGGDHQRAEVRLYTLAGCGACALARRILRRGGIEFEEMNGDGAPDFRLMLRERTGGSTVPQVVIDGEPIGGADSLALLARRGALLPRVRREPFPVAVVRRRLSPGRALTWPLDALRGGDSGPWSYRVELVGRDGRVLDRAPAESREHAAELAEALRAGLRE